MAATGLPTFPNRQTADGIPRRLGTATADGLARKSARVHHSLQRRRQACPRRSSMNDLGVLGFASPKRSAPPTVVNLEYILLPRRGGTPENNLLINLDANFDTGIRANVDAPSPSVGSLRREGHSARTSAEDDFLRTDTATVTRKSKPRLPARQTAGQLLQSCSRSRAAGGSNLRR